MSKQRIGVFTQSCGGSHLIHCLQSLELNSDWQRFDIQAYMVIDPLPNTEHEVNSQLTWLQNEFRWFYPIIIHDVHGAIPHRGLQGYVLMHLYVAMRNAGIDRFFHINDDVSFAKWWDVAAESALRDHGGECVVIPHDGISCTSQPVGTFSNFHYFDQAYVERYCPTFNYGGTLGDFKMPYYPGPQCYWHDTEFVLRAHYYQRLFYEPRCIVNHLHWSRQPSLMGRGQRRQTTADDYRDGLEFCNHMKIEGIDIWPVLRNTGFKIGNWQGELRAALESLHGITPPQ